MCSDSAEVRLYVQNCWPGSWSSGVRQAPLMAYKVRTELWERDVVSTLEVSLYATMMARDLVVRCVYNLLTPIPGGGHASALELHAFGGLPCWSIGVQVYLWQPDRWIDGLH